MKKNNLFFSLTFLLVATISFSQVQKTRTLQVGNTSTNSQNTSAALQIDDTARGLLLPRMTEVQRNAIASPATGLVIYNTTSNQLETNTGTPTSPIWMASNVGATGSTATVTGSNGVTVTSGNAALGGTLSNNTSINQADKNLAFTNSATTGTSHFTIDGSTFNVDAVNNRVGIGTSTPTHTLHVNGAARANYITNGDATSSNTYDLGVYNQSAGLWNRYVTNNASHSWFTDGNSTAIQGTTPVMTLSPSGNLGINRVNPTEKLDVGGNLKFSGALMPNNNPGSLGSFLSSSGPGAAPVWVPQTSISSDNLGNHTAITTLNMGGYSIFGLADPNSSPSNDFWSIGGNGTSDNGSLRITTGDNGDEPIIFQQIGPSSLVNERLRIHSNGFVGIGTSAPTHPLHVNGPARMKYITNGPATATIDYDLGFYNQSAGLFNRYVTTNGTHAWFTDGSATNPEGVTPSMSLTANGNLGINNASPSEKLDVSGNIKFSGALLPNNNAGIAGQVLTSGGIGTSPTWSSVYVSAGNLGAGTASPTSTLQSNGTFALNPATSGTANSVVLLASGTFTPPNPSTVTGRIYIIRNTSASTNVTIDSMIDYGASTPSSFTLTPTIGTIMIVSDGTNWFRIQ